jgi:hypothetical protein
VRSLEEISKVEGTSMFNRTARRNHLSQTQETKTEIDTGDAKIYHFPSRHPSPDREGTPVSPEELREIASNGYASLLTPRLYTGGSGDPQPKKFWERLYGTPDGEAYLNVFSGKRPENPPEKKGEVNKNRLVDFREKYFRWPEEADQAAEWVNQCAHLLNREKRIKANALSPITLYADGDGARIPGWMPQPTIIIESSPGRHWYLYRLTQPMSNDKFEALNETLTYAIGADKSGWDLSQVMRVPGTKNYKYEETPVVRVERLQDEDYDPQELEDALSPENLKKVLTEEHYEEMFGGSSKGTAEGAEERTDEDEEPPVLLNDYGMKVWRGEEYKKDENGDVDRSRSLLLIGRVLYDAGATEITIVEALKERDISLDWNKYSNRSDDKEYDEIYRELERKGRNNRDTRDSGDQEDEYYESGSVLGERVPLGELSKKGIDPYEMLVEDMLVKGFRHQIYSRGGSGKTFTALYAAKEVIQRGEVVIYLDLENGQRIMVERLIKVFKVDPDKVDEYFHYYPAPDLIISKAASEAFLKEIEKLESALLIFDASIDFTTYAGLNDNLPTDVATWFIHYVRPLHKQGITVLILDHTNRTDASDARGAGQKRNAVDVQWYLKLEKEFDRDTVGEIVLINKKDRQSWLPKEVRYKVGGTEDGFIYEKIATNGKVEVDLSPNQKKVLSVLQDQFGTNGATYTRASRSDWIALRTLLRCRSAA